MRVTVLKMLSKMTSLLKKWWVQLIWKIAFFAESTQINREFLISTAVKINLHGFIIVSVL